MKIGVIGSGRIGSTVGRLWAEAGHQVVFASRHPERLDALVAGIGRAASRGRPDEAARFGDVLLVSVPFGALPELGREIAPLIAGKVVLETSNPYPDRDGAIARDVLDKGLGTGRFAREHLSGARVVRAFNSVWDRTLAKEAHRPDPKIGIPLAGDDAEALETAATLVRDAGFEPIVVGPLDEARRFDVGTPVYNTGMSAADIRAVLGL
jgi:predicted dinucleotide-binding enzyme